MTITQTKKITQSVHDQKDVLWDKIEDINLRRQEEEIEEENLISDEEQNEQFLDSFFKKVKMIDTPPSQAKFYDLVENFSFYARKTNKSQIRITLWHAAFRKSQETPKGNYLTAIKTRKFA